MNSGEMTLVEYVGQLPKFHLASQELRDLKAEKPFELDANGSCPHCDATVLTTVEYLSDLEPQTNERECMICKKPFWIKGQPLPPVESIIYKENPHVH